MLTFLRKIRRSLIGTGGMRKYFLYAIGEILLVMIGILLALQVNNWNTERIEKKKVRGYALSLLQDLEANKARAESRKKGIDVLRLRIDSLRNYVSAKDLDEISNLDLMCLSWHPQYPAFSWRRSTIEELKNSEGLRLIKNKSLLELIVAYDAFLGHLDEDYSKDIKRSDLISEQLFNIVNTNYPQIVELGQAVDIFLETDRDAFVFTDSEPYRNARAFPISLLTKDLNDIHKMVNRLISHGSAFTIRSDEMSTLITDIEEIQELLRTEYLD